MLAYFFPALCALGLFLLGGPRDRAGWLALTAIVASWLAYVWVIPDNWYGGGGTVGNRYFLAVLPAFLFLVPARRAFVVAAAAVAAAGVFLAPMLWSPVSHSLRPGAHALQPAFRVLPAELTMLNDLSVFTEPWRKKRPFGFTGDASRHADPDAYFLYFMDDGAWGREEWGGRPGFWLRGGASAEVVVRAFDLAPVERVVLRVKGGPRGDQVTARRGFDSARVSVGPGEQRELELDVGRGVRYYDTYLHVLRLESRRGAALPDGRVVGAFVELRLVMGRDGRGGGAVTDRLARLGLGVVSGLVLLVALGGRPAAGLGRPLLERRGDLPRDGGQPRLRPRPGVHRRRSRPREGRLPGRTAGRLPEAGARRFRIEPAGVREGGGLSRVRRAARVARRHRPRPAAAERARVPGRAVARVRRAAAYGRSGRRPRPATLALVGLGVVPVYLLWQTPEVFNLALATAGLVAYRRDRPYLAAVLLGLAAYSKPTHLALALPLLLAPLVSAALRAGRAALLEAARRAVVLAAVVAAGFGVGFVLTGELNYQGGERKTFYDRYPFEPGVTFDSAGVWMTTDHVGPLVAGRDEHEQPDRVAPAARCRRAAPLVPAEPRLLLDRPLRRGARLLPGVRRGGARCFCCGARASGMDGWRSPRSAQPGSARSC